MSYDDIQSVRAASRSCVRELGLMDQSHAGTDLSLSAVHALIEVGSETTLTAKELGLRLRLEKSTISRLVKGLTDRGELMSSRSPTDGRAQILSLTGQGEMTLARIDAFTNRSVACALDKLDGVDAANVATAFSRYADAIRSSRGEPAPARHTPHEIVEGYQTGMIGDIAALHARTHAPIIGYGPAFESVVSQAMAEFMPRVGKPQNNSWSVVENGRTLASITIDGEDLDGNIAHLRWFILSAELRGKGLGKALLLKALAHCDSLGFDEIHLWTLKGLDAARMLYERNGFFLADEYDGDQWGKKVTEQKFIRKKPVI